MHWMQVHFSVSGVDAWIFMPPLVAFMISFVTSMGGLSGAFLPYGTACQTVNTETLTCQGTSLYPDLNLQF
jgi:hypothetical protein